MTRSGALSGWGLACLLLLASPAAGGAAPPGISAGNVTVTEGAAPAAHFVLRASRAAKVPMTVGFATVAGTAITPADYTSRSGRVRFGPGTRRKLVRVPVTDDALDEGTEGFALRLSKPRGARLRDRVGAARIVDDDPLPSLAVADLSVPEGTNVATTLEFPVTLSAPSGRPVTVGFSAADGSATAPSDYAAAAGTLTFAAGDTSEVATVIVVGDGVDEPDETLALNLTGPVNATLGDGSATATVLNDDDPALSIADASVAEGTGGATMLSFPVTLSAASAETVTVQFATADGSAVAPGDYIAAADELEFAPGDLSEPVTVTVRSDYGDELDAETFTVNLSDPVNATLADASATGSILDDDPPCVAPDPFVVNQNLGTISGDIGAGVLTRNDAINPCGDVDWSRFTLSENSSAPGATPLTAHARLFTASNDSPANGDLDLCVTTSPPNASAQVCSTLGAGLTETVCVHIADELGTDQTRELFLKVYGFGHAVNDYSLEVRGNQSTVGQTCLQPS